MINDHFEEYVRMRNEGLASKEAYRRAESSGLDGFARIRMLRSVFGLTLVEAKEVSMIADGQSSSLSEHQEKMLPALKIALRSRVGTPKLKKKK